MATTLLTVSAIVMAAASAVLADNPLVLNMSSLGAAYEGIGALSGGGGVTRLLIDYPPALQQDILDILFKPNAGASLQFIKVSEVAV